MRCVEHFSRHFDDFCLIDFDFRKKIFFYSLKYKCSAFVDYEKNIALMQVVQKLFTVSLLKLLSSFQITGIDRFDLIACLIASSLII